MVNIFDLQIRKPSTVHKNHHDLVEGRTYRIISMGVSAKSWGSGWEIGCPVIYEKEDTLRGSQMVIRATYTDSTYSWIYYDSMEKYEIILEDM